MAVAIGTVASVTLVEQWRELVGEAPRGFAVSDVGKSILLRHGIDREVSSIQKI
jgi:hypothetical protein